MPGLKRTRVYVCTLADAVKIGGIWVVQFSFLPQCQALQLLFQLNMDSPAKKWDSRNLDPEKHASKSSY